MSQQEPNSPESRNSAPQPQTSVPQSQILSKILAFLRTGTIRALRLTIRGLERTVETLEAQPDTNQTLNQFQIKLDRLWRNALTFIRTRLPESLNQKLNNRALTGIVAGLVIVGFWFTSSLFSAKPTPPPQVAKRPVVVPTQPTESFPSELSAPEPIPAPEIAVAPEPIASEPILDAPEPIVSESPVAVEPEPMPEVAASPTSEVEPTPEATPPPELVEPPPELTPEQQRIATVQTQVTEVSDRFRVGLIESVQPNFDRAQLRIEVSPDWYQFSAQQQDQLANALFERSQVLDLDRVEITDAKGTLLARPPVVGSDMIVLKRRQIG